MINTDMRYCNYFTYSEPNEYGQKTLLKDENGQPLPQGKIKIAIFNTSQSIQDNINYKGATYIGLTHDKSVSDNYVIEFENGEKLKVLYINPCGRFKQVFMARI